MEMGVRPVADEKKLSSDDAWIFAGCVIRDMQGKFREGFSQEYFLGKLITRADSELDSARYKVKDLREKLVQAMTEVDMLESVLAAAVNADKEFRLSKEGGGHEAG
jgi:hypothetical protein